MLYTSLGHKGNDDVVEYTAPYVGPQRPRLEIKVVSVHLVPLTPGPAR